MAWVGGFLPVVVGLLMLAARGLMTDLIEQVRAELDDELAGSGVSTNEALAALDGILIGVGLLMVVWGALIILFGIFAFRGAKWAVWALTVFGGIYVLLSLFGLFVEPLTSMIGILWVVGATVLYHLTPSREWYAAGAPKGGL